jgi:hypothetical protein
MCDHSSALVGKFSFPATHILFLWVLRYFPIILPFLQSLPGWDEELPSKMYSGYIKIKGDEGNKFYHYWFVESEVCTIQQALCDCPIVLKLCLSVCQACTRDIMLGHVDRSERTPLSRSPHLQRMSFHPMSLHHTFAPFGLIRPIPLAQFQCLRTCYTYMQAILCWEERGTRGPLLLSPIMKWLSWPSCRALEIEYSSCYFRSSLRLRSPRSPPR